LENAPSGGTVDLTTLTARVAALEEKLCPQQAVLDGMAADITVLKQDHVPTP
jgi:uncharacterized coiled-coil protein SlyX